MFVVDGTPARCLARFLANGAFGVPTRCKNAIPVLGRVKRWRWIGDDLSLGNAAGGEVMRFEPTGPDRWHFERPGAPQIVLYRMRLEVEPQRR